MDKNPKRRIPHGAVYVSTDPVAMDSYGWKVVQQARKENGLKTLSQAKRVPTYIEKAADLGLGVHAESKIRLTEVTI